MSLQGLKTQAIVLRKRVTSEGDLDLEILTPQSGKISVTAKNAQKITSSRLGQLQLGNTINAYLALNKNRYWLQEATSLHSIANKFHKLVQYNLLFLVLEIITNISSFNEESIEIYQITQKLITEIEKENIISIIKLELQLLQHLGFGSPAGIDEELNQKKYSDCQKRIIIYLQDIIEKPIQSKKLFS